MVSDSKKPNQKGTRMACFASTLGSDGASSSLVRWKTASESISDLTMGTHQWPQLVATNDPLWNPTDYWSCFYGYPSSTQHALNTSSFSKKMHAIYKATLGWPFHHETTISELWFAEVISLRITLPESCDHAKYWYPGSTLLLGIF